MTVIRPNSIAGITSLTALGTAIDFYNVNGAGIAFNNVNLNNTSGVSTFNNINASGIGTFSNGPVLIGSGTSIGTASQRLQVTGGAYVSGSLGIGNTNTTCGFACNSYGSQIVPGSQVYFMPSGRAHMLFGEATAGADLWVGFKGEYAASTGSVNILLQTNFQDTTQHAGGYIANEATSSTTSATTFGFLTGGSTTSTRPSKTERVRITSGGSVGIGTNNPGAELDVVGTGFFRTFGAGGAILRITSSGSINYIQSGTSLTADSKATIVFSSIYGATEYARFANTASGTYFKAANNGSYINTGYAWHEFSQWANDTNVAFLSRDTGNTATCFRLACSRTQSSSYFFATFESNGLGNDNEFTFRGDGVAAADGSFSGGGADYAEYFEWEDGNLDDEDRRGYSVSLIGNKIKIAEEGEQIIGVISANPSVVGDSAWNKWSGKYLTDDFGSYIFEEHNVVEWTDEDGKERSYEDWNLPEDVVVPEDAVIKTHDEKGNRFVHRKVNPEYNPNQEYIPREERKEWDAVGMMGKLRLRKGQLTGPNWIKLQDISATVEEWLVR